MLCWNSNMKEEITYFSAILILLFGIGLSTAGFIVSPLGVVDESVLWILGQCFIYAGSIFGITSYVKLKVNMMKTDLENDIRGDKNT